MQTAVGWEGCALQYGRLGVHVLARGRKHGAAHRQFARPELTPAPDAARACFVAPGHAWRRARRPSAERREDGAPVARAGRAQMSQHGAEHEAADDQVGGQRLALRAYTALERNRRGGYGRGLPGGVLKEVYRAGFGTIAPDSGGMTGAEVSS